MSRRIATAANAVVPAILILEQQGFTLTQSGELLLAERDGDTYVGEDPVAVLGLVSLVAARGWQWQAADEDIDDVLSRYPWV